MDPRIPPLARNSPRLALVLGSTLAAYVLVLAVRWIETDVPLFATLEHAVLATCFLGLATGLLAEHRPIDLRAGLAWLLVLTTALALPITIGGVVAFGVMVALALAFFPLGQMIGQLIDHHPRTVALTVAASLLGMWLFVALSALSLGPTIWGLVLVALAAPLTLHRGDAAGTLPGAALLLALAGSFFAAERFDGASATVWSPYQKLAVDTTTYPDGTLRHHVVTANTTGGLQKMLDLDFSTSSPLRQPAGLFELSQVDVPYRLHGESRRVLLVGAGIGNDAAAALRLGVHEITTVDLDPGIVALARTWHPNKPYDDPRVKVVTDDPRSFFATTHETYDLIVFGLLDIHPAAALTAWRRDHSLYTAEGLAQAKRLLAPGGQLVLSVEMAAPHVGDRIARALTETFGEPPIAVRFPPDDFGPGGTVFVAGDLERARRMLAKDGAVARRISRLQMTAPLAFPLTTSVSTDDWPYLVLEEPTLPPQVALFAILLPAAGWTARRMRGLPTFRSGWRRDQWPFFFSGAALLLLGVWSLHAAGLIFGSTWQVNTLVLSGLVGVVLLAGLAAATWRTARDAWAIVVLIGSCLALFFLDVGTFAGWSSGLRVLVVGGGIGLLAALFGGVFARSLEAVHSRGQALGATLLGGCCGAVLQSITFLIGFQALLLVVAALYMAAALTRPGRSV